jgi:hypothetical protein
MEVTESILTTSSLQGTRSEENHKKSKKGSKFDKNRIKLAKQLQVHDFLMRQDFDMLNSAFYVCPRPSGDRCLI